MTKRLEELFNLPEEDPAEPPEVDAEQARVFIDDRQEALSNANDIIEFNGVRWEIAFNSQTDTEVQYVTNLTTSIQYKWTGDAWVKSIDGLYAGGAWNLIL